MTSVRELELGTRLEDVVSLPEFGRYGELLIPQGLRRTSGLTMRDIGALMPYHSNVRPEECLRTIESMRRRVRDGRLVMLPLRRGADDGTGVFLFKGDAGAPTAFICAGGGMRYVASVHEAFPHAMVLSDMGYNAAVVQYRTGDMSRACRDLSAAIDAVLGDAEALSVHGSSYSVWGSSAGARMAAYVGSYGPTGFGGRSSRPGCVMMAYTGHTDLTPRDPPTFSVVGSLDGIADPRVMMSRTERLRRLGVDADITIIDGMGHGFGLGTGTPAEGWILRAEGFWRRHLDHATSLASNGS